MYVHPDQSRRDVSPVLGMVLLVAALTASACAPAAAPPAVASTPVRPTAAAAAPQQPIATSSGAAQPQPATTGPRSYTPTPLNPRVPVRVMDNQVTSMVPVYIAYDRGYFSDEGLDIDLEVLNDNAAILQTVATNQSQFALTTPDPVIFNAIARGIDIKILAPSTVNAPADRPAQFVVRQDLVDGGGFKSPADLRGRTVAVPAQSSLWYVEKELSRGGLALTDVNTTVVRTPDMPAAFQTRSIDAAWVPEPAASAINAQRFGTTVASTGELYPGAVAAALLMSPKFGQDHADAAQRFVIAYTRGARAYYSDWMLGADKPSIVQSFVTHTTIKDPTLYDHIGLPSVDPNVSTDLTESWNVFQDFFVRQGLQEQKLDLGRYVDYALVNGALQQLGRV